MSTWWAVAGPEPSGRLLLPSGACTVLGAEAHASGVVSGLVHGDVLVLRPGAGAGRVMTVDSRSRLYLPVCLRRHPCLLIGTSGTDELVVLAPSTVLDRLGDQLLEGSR